MRKTVVVTVLGLLLSGMSMPSVHASNLSAASTSLDEQIAEMSTDVLPPLCVVREIEDEPSPTPTPTATPTSSPTFSASPTALPSVSPSASPSTSPSPTSSPTEEASLTSRTIDVTEGDPEVVPESDASREEDGVEESPEEDGIDDSNKEVKEEKNEEEREEDAESPPQLGACPVAPTRLSADAGNNEVRLTWSPGAVPSDDDRFTDPVAYYVSVTGPDSKVLRTTDTTLGVLGLRNGVAYSFEVFAATVAGRSAPAGPLSATPTTGMEGVVAGLIVEFAEGVDAPLGSGDVPGQDRVDGVDLSIAQRVSDDAVLVELSEPVDLATANQIANDLARDEKVTWAEPDQFFFTSSENFAQTVSVPADSQYVTSQWNLWDSYGISIGDGSDSMTQAWTGARGDGVNVAVIDTGITKHPDLDTQLVSGFDFVSNPEKLASSRQPNAPPVAFDGDYIDEATYGALGRDANPQDPGDWRDVTPIRGSSWHGTKIAGLIAAASNDDGITGIAPNAKIQPIRALSWRGGLLSDIAASITWASGGAIDGVPDNETPSTIINMSFAVETTCPRALQDAIDDATERGRVLVAAAGNAGADASLFAPGNCNGVITVGATNRDGLRADYSNYGSTVDISAPGGDAANPVTTTTNSGVQEPDEATTGADFGTSISAAHVSAAAAILISRNAQLTPADVYATLTSKDFIKDFANPTCDADPDYSCGAGILSLAQVATVASGDQDFSMTFNGSTQSAEGTGSSTAFNSFNAITIEAWVKPTSCSSTRAVIRKSDSFGILCTDGTWGYFLKGTSAPTVATTSSARFGQWQHIALTRAADTNVVNFYVDGQLVFTGATGTNGAGTRAITDSLGNLYIASNGGTSQYLDGVVDEVRLYSAALTQDQILSDMHTYGMNSSVLAAQQRAYYDFNEGPAGFPGSGTVYNRVTNAAAGSNLRAINGPTYADVLSTATTGGDTVVTFPRSYLTAAGGWRPPDGVSTVRALVVGGGGGGGGDNGGGGGAGGVYDSITASVSVGGGVQRVVVGQGGTGRNWPYSSPVGVGPYYGSPNGQTTEAFGLSAGGGGLGGSADPGDHPDSGTRVSWGMAGASKAVGTVGAGGSGGGGASEPTDFGNGGAAGTGDVNGTSGGAGLNANRGAASGGGAGEAGINAVANNIGRNGGDGVQSDITGADVYYGGGGGGGNENNTGPTRSSGGLGGGGQGAASDTSTGGYTIAGSGSPNTGGGGGGGSYRTERGTKGGNGGSGVVIIRYTGQSRGTCTPAESQTTSDGKSYRIIAFKTTGSCTWKAPVGVSSVDYVVIAGGGGGGVGRGGGGGAGGMLDNSLTLSAGQTYTVTVGAGGAGGRNDTRGKSGGSSSFATVTATGGGGGGAWPSSAKTGLAGGSGGGAAGGGSFAGGLGTSLQGSNGGPSVTNSGGGGGGAGAVGATGTSSQGGAGGAGRAIAWLPTSVASELVVGQVSDSAVYFAGGGGGGAVSTASGGGAGGVGGGAAGLNKSGSPGPTPATANTGGGGGGNEGYAGPGGAGGSGVVVLRYEIGCTPSTYTYTSGTTPYTVVEFQDAGSCSWTPPTWLTSVDVLAVGGGGGGGAWVGGGGGGGGVTSQLEAPVSGGTSVSVTVGSGGSGATKASNGTFTAGTNGATSNFGSVTALGGGVGASETQQPAGSGGGVATGGGGSQTTGTYAGGINTSSGYNGGNAATNAQPHSVGGGAGAGANGASGSGNVAGAGGLGATSSITGASVYYVGGGGGSAHGTWSSGTAISTVTTPGAGGLGGGGAGGQAVSAALNTIVRGSSGTNGLGGGGGGAANFYTSGTTLSSIGGNGGTGTVIVRYVSNRPDAPTDVTATAGGGDATIAWSAPVYTGGSPLTGYTVTASPGGATCTPSPATARTCTVTGLTVGTKYTFTVTASNINGTGDPSEASNEVTILAAENLAMDRQPVGAASESLLATQPWIKVVDPAGVVVVPSPTIPVTVSASGGTLTGTLTVSTDAVTGLATFTNLVFSGIVGEDYTLTFTSPGIPSVTSDVFTPSGAGPATSMVMRDGDDQSATVATAVTTRPTVQATDVNGNVVSGVSVTFAVASGGGSVGTPATVTTNAEGIAISPAWTLGEIAGANTLTATSDALPDSLVTFTATGTAAAPSAARSVLTVSATSVPAQSIVSLMVQAKDVYGNSLTTGGATVTFTRSSGTGTIGAVTDQGDGTYTAPMTHRQILAVARSPPRSAVRLCREEPAPRRR